jgi:membrane-associated phospholipid phosphatase
MPLRRTFDTWVNPLYENPGARARLSPGLRPLRSVAISLRNLAFGGSVMLGFSMAADALPKMVFVAVMFALAGAVYWQIHQRDRRGIEVKPPLLLGFFLVLFALMSFSRSAADTTGLNVQYNYVIEADAAIFGSVPTVWLQEHLYTPGSVTPIDVYASLIYFSYFAVPALVGVVLWHLNPKALRVYLVATVLLIGSGTISFALLPTAPPWLAAIDGYLPPVSRIAPEVMNTIRPGFYYQGYRAVGVNDVAAFPSYHTAQTVLVMLIAWRYAPGLRKLGVFYLASMCFALVYLGEHYVADELAGIGIAAVAWTLALWITPKAARDRVTERAPEVEAAPIEERRAA